MSIPWSSRIQWPSKISNLRALGGERPGVRAQVHVLFASLHQIEQVQTCSGLPPHYLGHDGIQNGYRFYGMTDLWHFNFVTARSGSH